MYEGREPRRNGRDDWERWASECTVDYWFRKHIVVTWMNHNLISSNKVTSSTIFWPHSLTQSKVEPSRLLSWSTFARPIWGTFEIMSISRSVKIQVICRMPLSGSFWCVHDRQAYRFALSGSHSLTGRNLGLGVAALIAWSMNTNVSVVSSVPGK